ncbi:MAG: DJ-1/PfpI family protein [Corticimicrobacter sp.]|uniref:DJ-1/PfpI family protein n=1 Tax=Corticimicrobacter sp. TaxID=2678536 RepID=UPI0032DB5F5A
MITVVIPLYKGVTHLDFTGPHQVLSSLPEVDVRVASLGGLPICADGLTFSNLVDLEAIQSCQVLCVPGGLGCFQAMENPVFIAAIQRLAAKADYVTSVCTGSLILGAAGLLKGRRATTHWAWRHMLVEFGAVVGDDRVVRDGNIMTGSGITAGIDFALTLVAEVCGTDIAQYIQLMLEYAPAPPFEAGRPETAPAHISAAFMENMRDVLGDSRKRIHAAAQRVAEVSAVPAL